MTRTREAELAETRLAIDRAAAELSARATENEANFERNRAAWHAEREHLLAQSEESTQARVQQALDHWRHETEAALANAKQEWLNGEEARLEDAEAKWRENIGIAKSRTPITKMEKRGRRVRTAGRFKRFEAIAGCLVAAVIIYPRIEPVLVEHWWPKIVAYKGEIQPSLRDAAAEIKAWLFEMEKRGEAIRKNKAK